MCVGSGDGPEQEREMEKSGIKKVRRSVESFGLSFSISQIGGLDILAAGFEGVSTEG